MRQFSTTQLILDELNWYSKEGMDPPQIGFLDNESILGNYPFKNRI